MCRLLSTAYISKCNIEGWVLACEYYERGGPPGKPQWSTRCWWNIIPALNNKLLPIRGDHVALLITRTAHPKYHAKWTFQMLSALANIAHVWRFVTVFTIWYCCGGKWSRQATKPLHRIAQATGKQIAAACAFNYHLRGIANGQMVTDLI